MITLLSPSKSMTLDAAPHANHTQPAFLDQSEKIIHTLRTFSTAELMNFMGISEQLAGLNRDRFNHWTRPFTPDNAKPALFAFTGDVYDGLGAPTLSAGDLTFAQNHLRILSGLYGLLRPLDLIQPYRLEMGRPLKTPGADNLYALWREPITAELNRLDGSVLINLASQEYFKAIDGKQLTKTVISPIFKDEKNGTLKIISFYAKKARGSMARYIIEHQLTRPAELLAFDTGGYRHAPDLSTETAPVFIREQQTF